MADKPAEATRIVSLDQFRGYTVLGMFLVNFVGSFAVIKSVAPLLAHHHTYCSYADTIMPQFFFAAGFSYRLTFLRRRDSQGIVAVYRHAVKRNLALLLLGFVVHHLDGHFESWSQLEDRGLNGWLQTAFQRHFFQTLTHIGVTSLWIMPVIAARPALRILFAMVSALAFHLLSQNGYYEWVVRRPGIDGGPLGFLTWTIPMIVGTLACDCMSRRDQPSIARLWMGAATLMLLGYLVSCFHRLASFDASAFGDGWASLFVEPPFVPPMQPVDIWTMSQRAGSVSYLTFGAGFALAIYALFVMACDKRGLLIGIFRTLGTNALVAYIVHDLVNQAIKPFVPNDSPLWFISVTFGLSLAICYLFLRSLEKQRLFLRL